MSELFINNAKACAVTGHRVLEISFDKNNVKKVLLELINNGYDTFLIGMALGFDTVCFQLLSEIKKEKDIKIIACIPCPTQSYKFSKKQKKLYDEMVSTADEKIILSPSYDEKCMQRRNKYMVDNCSVLLAYLRRDFGGTVNTVKYAQKKGIKIIKV